MKWKWLEKYSFGLGTSILGATMFYIISNFNNFNDWSFKGGMILGFIFITIGIYFFKKIDDFEELIRNSEKEYEKKKMKKEIILILKKHSK